LEVKAEVLESSKYACTKGEDDEVRHQEGAVPKQMEREHGLGMADLLPNEEGDEDRG
jgi:hypothetical protein